MTQDKGPLIILSGPSGSGKSTVLARLLAESPWPLRLSVSATTRAPRPGEQDGVAYFFWTREEFEREVQAGAFLEWAEVHGNCYGTLRREVEPYRDRGVGVILDIDTQGARRVRQACPDQVSVFLEAPHSEDYEARLRKRGTETEEAIRRRVAAAARELSRAGEYDYRVVNDDLDTAVARLREIVAAQFEGRKHAG
jgi:guanylate kinase